MAYALLIGAIIVIAVVIAVVVAGRKQDEAWKEFGAEIGAEFVAGSLFRTSKLQAPVGEVVATLDTYSVPSGDSSTTYTRWSAPFQNKPGLQFSIRRQGLIARLDKALGMQDIEVGDPEFDDKFIVQGQPVAEVQRLLSSMGIRQMLGAQKSVSLQAKGSVLRLEVLGVVREMERLRSLYQLLRAVLQELK